MFLTNRTVITFDPVREYDVMNKFMEENDMTEWKEHPSTVGFTFVREIRLSLEYGEGKNEFCYDTKV